MLFFFNIKLTLGWFCILINVKYQKRYWCIHSLCAFWVVSWSHSATKNLLLWRLLNLFGIFFVMGLQRVLQKTSDHFFLLLLSFLLAFRTSPLKILKQPFNLLILHTWSIFIIYFFYHILSIFFWLLFFFTLTNLLNW
jgi:hypothetical protein